MFAVLHRNMEHSFQDLPLVCRRVTPVLMQQQKRQTMTILQGNMVA